MVHFMRRLLRIFRNKIRYSLFLMATLYLNALALFCKKYFNVGTDVYTSTVFIIVLKFIGFIHMYNFLGVFAMRQRLYNEAMVERNERGLGQTAHDVRTMKQFRSGWILIMIVLWLPANVIYTYLVCIINDMIAFTILRISCTVLLWISFIIDLVCVIFVFNNVKFLLQSARPIVGVDMQNFLEQIEAGSAPLQGPQNPNQPDGRPPPAGASQPVVVYVAPAELEQPAQPAQSDHEESDEPIDYAEVDLRPMGPRRRDSSGFGEVEMNQEMLKHECQTASPVDESSNVLVRASALAN